VSAGGTDVTTGAGVSMAGMFHAVVCK
jgi:hypothetical protein